MVGDSPCPHCGLYWAQSHDANGVHTCPYEQRTMQRWSLIGEDWRSRAEKAEAENKRLRALLKRLEFASWEYSTGWEKCAICHRFATPPQHYDGCELKAALDEEKA